MVGVRTKVTSLSINSPASSRSRQARRNSRPGSAVSTSHSIGPVSGFSSTGGRPRLESPRQPDGHEFGLGEAAPDLFPVARPGPIDDDAFGIGQIVRAHCPCPSTGLKFTVRSGQRCGSGRPKRQGVRPSGLSDNRRAAARRRSLTRPAAFSAARCCEDRRLRDGEARRQDSERSSRPRPGGFEHARRVGSARGAKEVSFGGHTANTK